SDGEKQKQRGFGARPGRPQPAPTIAGAQPWGISTSCKAQMRPRQYRVDACSTRAMHGHGDVATAWRHAPAAGSRPPAHVGSADTNKKPAACVAGFLATGGVRGIRTLDRAFDPILP